MGKLMAAMSAHGTMRTEADPSIGDRGGKRPRGRRPVRLRPLRRGEVPAKADGDLSKETGREETLGEVH